ncbi:MAG: hypothetical protein WBQ25_24485 [Nitrososphaeraceae archaeon]
MNILELTINQKIGGLAKAMVVASTRIQAFRYKQKMNNEGMVDLLHIY